jgi:hypothetical protein
MSLRRRRAFPLQQSPRKANSGRKNAESLNLTLPPPKGHKVLHHHRPKAPGRLPSCPWYPRHASTVHTTLCRPLLTALILLALREFLGFFNAVLAGDHCDAHQRVCRRETWEINGGKNLGICLQGLVESYALVGSRSPLVVPDGPVGGRDPGRTIDRRVWDGRTAGDLYYYLNCQWPDEPRSFGSVLRSGPF